MDNNYSTNTKTALVLIPFGLITILEIFFSFLVDIPFYPSIRAFLFSVFLGYIFFVLVLALTKKYSRATIITSVVIFVLLLVNTFKVEYTGEPVYFSDLNFLSSSSELIEIVSKNLFEMIGKYILKFTILAGVLAFVCAYTIKYDFNINIKKRLVSGIVAMGLILLLFVPCSYTKKVYMELIFGMSNVKDYDSYTSNFNFYFHYSMLSGMYGVMLNNRFTEPEEYDKVELESILSNSGEDEQNTSLGTPNIIIVFSEAFWDVKYIDEVTFDKDITYNFNELETIGKKVNMISSAYGGVSENVAFELLTGGSMNYFSAGYIPIMSLYNRENSDKSASIVSVLKNSGYTSSVIFGQDYYSSEKAFNAIGFDNYEEISQDDATIKGNYISDEYSINYLISKIEEKNENSRGFYMLETIQNHMPYYNKYDSYDISILESSLTSEMNDTILGYAQGIYDADNSLKMMYEYINTLDEPTILIFLGDHLPYLNTKYNKNVLDSISYFNTDDELLNTYRKYNTQALILANYDIDYSIFPDYLSPDMLLTCIINNMDIEVPNYYKWLYSTIEDLPSSNKYVSQGSDGNLYDTSALTDKMLETYSMRELMQYMMFIDIE